MPIPSSVFDGVEKYITNSRQEFETLLGGLVEIPSISADPEQRDSIVKAAGLAAQYLQDFGATVEMVETPGNPVIMAKMLTDSGNPTITIYNHIDVQPAQEPEWIREPFSFRVEGDQYFGRGCTDDKGPALTALFAARYAIGAGVPINIHFIWELEEEIGSPNFEHFIDRKRSELATDSVLVSDTVWLSRNIPAIPYSLRGMLPVILTLQTGTEDAHSGLTGGAARNPIGELCEVIAACLDSRTGRVKIPGFYDDVIPVTEEEMSNFLSSGFEVDGFIRDSGLIKLRTLDKREIIDRIWCQPTFEVHGIVGGYTGPGIKTVVPPKAEAKISMRLVANQDAPKISQALEDFVKRINPDVQVEFMGSAKAYLGEFSGDYADAARRSINYAFGSDPAFIRGGGSIGAVLTLRDYLQAPVVLIGLSLPEHGYHAPNENFDWVQASGGMKAFVKYFDEVSTIGIPHSE